MNPRWKLTAAALAAARLAHAYADATTAKISLITGFAGSLIQLLMGLKNLSYATSALAAVAIILLDYVFAFTVTGLGGLFRGRMKQIPALISGTALACLLRYTFHVIAGCTVWAGLSIPDSQALLYSLAYNAIYIFVSNQYLW